MNLTALSNAELDALFMADWTKHQRGVAGLVAELAEIESRNVHLEAAYASLYDYCVRRAGMSEATASRKSNAARLVRRFPQLLGHLERGTIHLCTLLLVRDHLTEENCDELVAAVSGKSRRQVEEILAARAPRPDTPSFIERASEPTRSLPAMEISTPAAPAARTRIQPIAVDRCEVRFSASRAFCEKLERVRDLMRHRNPSGEFEQVFDPALDLLLAKLEKERLGKVKKPRARASGKTANDGDIPAAVRREVFARDGEQCSFTDETGCRCTSRHKLELDHIVPRALGGMATVDNLRVVCRAHNTLYAEKKFGREHIGKKIEERRRKTERDAVAPPNDLFDLASRALKSMGFKEPETRRAVTKLRELHLERTPPPIESLVREALQLLT